MFDPFINTCTQINSRIKCYTWIRCWTHKTIDCCSTSLGYDSFQWQSHCCKMDPSLQMSTTTKSGGIVVVIIWWLDLQLPMRSVPITTNVVSLNPAHGKLYTTLCDKVCQGLVAVLWFSLGTLVFSTNKTDRHDITEVLLKVALNTITLQQSLTSK